MKSPLSICSVTSGRADYGPLLSVWRALRDPAHFNLSIVLTGQHLVDGSREAANRLRADGFSPSFEIDMKIGEDDNATVIKSAAKALEGAVDAFLRLKPDILLVLGDRYEIAAVVLGATIARIPIAHIAGGDITAGAFDDALRHAISKMAHIHFVTNELSARRLRQLGEEAERIHLTGSPGLDLIRGTTLPSRDEFFAAIGLPPQRLNLLVTFHPETLAMDSMRALEELLAAIEGLGQHVGVLFTGSNADPGARGIDARIAAFVNGKSCMRQMPALRTERYFGALAYMDVIVGNSSSGLYEAPSFGIPTVNVGDRQAGRLKADSVFDCPSNRREIARAIRAALDRGRRLTENPYGDGHASERIARILAKIAEPRALLNKRFVDSGAA
jgi:UDP-hydrolysing UDP-N-acetyl-D-glucosamine 2-epimerase